MSSAWRFYLGLYAGSSRTIALSTARTLIQVALALPIAVPLGRLFNSASPPAGLWKIGASDSMEPSIPKPLCRAIYVALLVPITLFILSLFIRPQVSYDPAYGFAALRSMLDGGSFNYITTPNPGNIANDIETFLTWWSPGQYLVPGLFVRLGASYGVAASLTTLIATIVGVLGWAQIARRFDISCFALFLFILGLVTFNYSTGPFHRYTGGEVIVFAVLPWCLTALQWAVQERPAVSFATSVLVATVLFFAKLSGLVAFVANVAGISLYLVLRLRRPTSSLLAMWAGSAVAGLFCLIFWLSRGHTPVGNSAYAFTWPVIWYPISAAAFSGFSMQDLLGWRFLHASAPILSGNIASSYVLGPLGLLLIGWVWLQLRNTRNRSLVSLLLLIIAFYTATIAALYFRAGPATASLPFEARYSRYAGILFFLLLLVAIDQWRGLLARIIAMLIVGFFGAYGLSSYAKAAREIMRDRQYDQASGISMSSVSPVVLAYLRSELAEHRWHNAVAVVPAPWAAMGLPNFRIILGFYYMDNTSLEQIARKRWSGRSEKIFVIVNEKMRAKGKAEAVLRTFVDYDFDKWSEIDMGGMIVYSQ